MHNKLLLIVRTCVCVLLSLILVLALFACEAVQGERGEQGEQGIQGEQGVQGPQGEQGPQGAQGEKGETGEQGPQGVQGEKGPQGEAGKDGSVLSIGENGNWYIDDVDTGVPASGENVESVSLVQATANVKRSTVTVCVRTEAGSAIGSGFVYDAAGHICTNHHVIEDATFVQVILPDGTAREAQILGSDAAADVAVIRVEQEGLVPATLGDSDLLMAGDRVLAVGTPTALSYMASATYGFVCVPSRLLLEEDASGSIVKKMRVIQTDTPVNPGNSGGPLADAYGRVVGVVTMKLLTTQSGVDVENMGFALPINGVRQIVDAIIANGAFTGENPISRGRTLIGMSGYGVSEGYWYYLDLLTSKVVQSETQKFGYHYAEKTGIYVSTVTGANVLDKMQEGDIVLRANGYSLAYITELIALVNLYEAGDEITLSVWRGGTEVEVTLTLSEEMLS